MSDEQAKAIQDVAKTTHKALEIGEKAGTFLAHAFGPFVENSIGVVADRIQFYRLTQFFRLVEKTKSILARRGVTVPRCIPPGIGLPLIEAATAEDNDELHDLWAHLLASAMDPAASQSRRSFVGILQQMEPSDAKLLIAVHRMTTETSPEERHAVFDPSRLRLPLADLAERAQLPLAECELALWNLERLGCIEFQISHFNLFEGPFPKQPIALHLTSLGLAFLIACTPSSPD